MTDPTPLARLHHYLPQCYLAGFTSSGRKDGYLTTRRIGDLKAFSSKPKGIGAEHDFNRIELDGYRPDALEKGLSKFESELAISLAKLAKTRQFPPPEDLNLILNLASLMHSRHPVVRRRFASANSELIIKIMRLVTREKSFWESEMKAATAAGYLDEASTITYEQAKDFVHRGEYTVETDSMHQHVREFHTQGEVLTRLGQLSWSLFVSDEFEFISTDRPVTVRRRGAQALHGPSALSNDDVEVLFPTSSKTLLFGVYTCPAPEVVQLSKESVGRINSRILVNAEQFYFGRGSNFLADGPTGPEWREFSRV